MAIFAAQLDDTLGGGPVQFRQPQVRMDGVEGAGAGWRVGDGGGEVGGVGRKPILGGRGRGGGRRLSGKSYLSQRPDFLRSTISVKIFDKNIFKRLRCGGSNQGA